MKIFQVELFKKMAKARIPSSFHNGHATRKPSSWSYPTGEIDLNHTLTNTLSLHVLRPLLPAAGGRQADQGAHLLQLVRKERPGPLTEQPVPQLWQ